jgi:hypothetical protein
LVFHFILLSRACPLQTTEAIVNGLQMLPGANLSSWQGQIEKNSPDHTIVWSGEFFVDIHRILDPRQPNPAR